MSTHRRVFPFLVAALWGAGGCAAPDSDAPAAESQGPQDPTLVAATHRFEFHSNFWVNLSHTLYKVVAEEGRTPLQPPELARIASLSPEEREIWEEAVAYYAEHHAGGNVRTDDSLYAFKRWAVHLPEEATLTSTELDPAWMDVLNRVAPIYRERFWPAHDSLNRAVVARHLDTVQRIEDRAFDRLSRLARYDWPPGPIRVDVTAYANWAGAYTTNQPTHVMISSVDIQPPSNWLELVFHEASHGIMGSWSPVGEVIDSVATARGARAGQMWHALLFYFSGRTVQDEVARLGMDHTLYMVDRSVFANTHPSLFRHAEPYVQGQIPLETAVERIYDDLENPRP